MHGKSKIERDAAVAFIVKESIEITVKKNASKGKQYFAKRNVLFTFSWLYLRKLFYCYFFNDIFKWYNSIDTTTAKRSFNLRTGVLNANEKRKKK